MANETLTGCVTWPGGVITFTQNSGCCRYSGCIEWTGIHAGQVAITIDTDNCNDTYYGCINWTTGAFEVSVPDNCCDNGEGSDIICGCCCNCWNTHKSPLYYSAFVSGSGAANGHYTLEWFGGDYCKSEYGGNGCCWSNAGDACFAAGPYPCVTLCYMTEEVRKPLFYIFTGVGVRTFYYDGDVGDECSEFMCGDYDSQNPADGGNVKLFPATSTEWTQNTSYDVDDYVFLTDTYYICIQDHTSCDGGCPDPDKPGLGDEWEDYWEVATCPTSGSC